MLRFAVLAGFVWFSSTWLLGLLERYALYAFDPTIMQPADIGLTEITPLSLQMADQTHVIWIAQPKAGKPTIVYFHGNAGNLANRAQRFQKLLSRGYGLVAWAYSGSSGSTGHPSQAVMTANANRIWTSLGTMIPEPSAKVIYGESIGAAVALQLIGTYPTTNPAAVILEAPFTNMIEVGQNLYPQLASALPQVLNDTWTSDEMAPSLTQPLLIIHGTEDALIPQEMGRKIYGLAASTEKNFYSVKGADHINTWQSEAQKTLWRFIDTYGR